MKPTSICENRKMADLSLRNSYQWGWKIQQTLHSSQFKTTAFRPGFTEFLGKSCIFTSSVIYPSVLKSLSANSFHCLTLLLPENIQKNSLVLRNNCRRDPRSPPSTDSTERSAPGLRVIGVERLLEPVAGARGHLVHACSQEIKSHFQRRASIPLSNSNIWNPKAVPLLPNRSHTGSEKPFVLPTDGFLPMTHPLKGLPTTSGFSFSII